MSSKLYLNFDIEPDHDLDLGLDLHRPLEIDVNHGLDSQLGIVLKFVFCLIIEYDTEPDTKLKKFSLGLKK